jgi:hypothetical protein
MDPPQNQGTREQGALKESPPPRAPALARTHRTRRNNMRIRGSLGTPHPTTNTSRRSEPWTQGKGLIAYKVQDKYRYRMGSPSGEAVWVQNRSKMVVIVVVICCHLGRRLGLPGHPVAPRSCQPCQQKPGAGPPPLSTAEVGRPPHRPPQSCSMHPSKDEGDWCPLDESSACTCRTTAAGAAALAQGTSGL